MNELSVFKYGSTEVVDSRDVASMVEKRHDNLMRDIEGYKTVMEKNNALKSEVVNFFIPGTYTDSKGETRPCYLLTKKGCDMVANKMTGEKGIIFTAAYVSAFEKPWSGGVYSPRELYYHDSAPDMCVYLLGHGRTWDRGPSGAIQF